MLKERMDIETLGAEALPGGLAEILRTLQPVLAPAIAQRRMPQARGFSRFFIWRREKQYAS